MSLESIIFLIFLVGYSMIIIEHQIKIDKMIPALGMMVLSWTVVSLNQHSISEWLTFDPRSGQDILLQVDNSRLKMSHELLNNTLLRHFGKTCEILFFLAGAMTIVELIDHFNGFSPVTNLIKTRKKVLLLWIISLLAFFLSAIIDNLTATIVLITILRKTLNHSIDRLWFSGFVIIAANAGGAWSPIGDVTTTMLWMAGKVSSGKLIASLFFPSFISLIIPLTIGSFLTPFKGKIDSGNAINVSSTQSTWILISGLCMIVSVPVFKTLTHLPPYIGMMLSLTLMALVSEAISKRNIRFTTPDSENSKKQSSPTLDAISKIEMPSILFFLGILMTVAAIESTGMIHHAGIWINERLHPYFFVSIIGVVSAIIDNVPLVAGGIGMFSQPADSDIWHLLAYAAGTGGSLLIIGSAAGVVAMGMEKISFLWYLKNITLLALLGYLGGITTFLLFHP